MGNAAKRNNAVLLNRKQGLCTLMRLTSHCCLAGRQTLLLIRILPWMGKTQQLFSGFPPPFSLWSLPKGGCISSSFGVVIELLFSFTSFVDIYLVRIYFSPLIQTANQKQAASVQGKLSERQFLCKTFSDGLCILHYLSPLLTILESSTESCSVQMSWVSWSTEKD